jgi:hypothetical protein
MASDSKIIADSRPTEYAVEIGTAICEQLVEGKSLRAICADPGLPDKATVLGWLPRHQEFRKSYELAQWLVLNFLEEEILEIVDDADGDWIEKVRPGGRVVMVRDPQHLARRRLRANVRSWIADRMAGVRTETVKQRLKHREVRTAKAPRRAKS